MEGTGVDHLFPFGVRKASVDEHKNTDDEQDNAKDPFHMVYLMFSKIEAKGVPDLVSYLPQTERKPFFHKPFQLSAI